jgi:hypothetical protein
MPEDLWEEEGAEDDEEDEDEEDEEAEEKVPGELVSMLLLCVRATVQWTGRHFEGLSFQPTGTGLKSMPCELGDLGIQTFPLRPIL